MKYDEETINKFLKLINKQEKSVARDIAPEMGMTKLEVMGLVYYLRNNGINIAENPTIDDVYILNNGDKKYVEKNFYNVSSDDNDEFKFLAIADTRLGSKSQQLSLLNALYLEAHERGFNNVILCGNISAGLYKLDNEYAETNFINDSFGQIDYIASHYPKVDGMKTYFITGATDEKHLSSKNKINIGKRIAELRDDMVYLGDKSCDFIVDDTVIRLYSTKLAQAYTKSYRSQQQVLSIRSEDKPDIVLYGGMLGMEKYTYRQITVFSIPSVCATTKEMDDNRRSNTIGAWYVTIKNVKGKLDSVNGNRFLCRKTIKDDYLTAKVLKGNAKVKKIV